MEKLFLDYYKRKEIQEEILCNAKDREVIARFRDSFSKRPDILKYTGDVLELAKQGATSFHASEELWKNPLQLSPSLKKHELDALRTGWDLLIDIDCPYWEYSKLIARFVISSLNEHKVKSISCKFSGNKGFHIGVPFEAFPNSIAGKETRLRFPDDVRVIAAYLVAHIDIGGRFTKEILSGGIDEVIRKTGKPYNELVSNVCESCETRIQINDRKFELICPKCGLREAADIGVLMRRCGKCSLIMEKKELSKTPRCPKCKSTKFKIKFNTPSILSIDSILISSRHLYRMPYSLHESSGLASLPLNPARIMEFRKADAVPELARISKYRFLEKEDIPENNAAFLFDEALAWHSSRIEKDNLRESLEKKKHSKPMLSVESAIPEMFFPPCISLINQGMEDGKKRALFVLINFYSSVGWNYGEIEKKLAEWNEKNKEPLRQNYLLGQLRYHRQMKKKALPPNCDNEMYMKGINVCKPDNFCQRIKNPANYAIRRALSIHKPKSKNK